MSGYHFTQQDKFILDRLVERIAENRANGGPVIGRDDLERMVHELDAQHFGLPPGHVAVPVETLERIDNALHDLLAISAGLHSTVMHDDDTDYREHWLNEFDAKHDEIHEVRERVFDLIPTAAAR